MVNFYYGYSILWSFILVLYLLGFSDLCQPLDIKLLIFLIISICTSAVVGYFQKDKFNTIKFKEKPHKNSKITIMFAIYFILEILIARKIPLLNVIAGQSYSTVNFQGINGLHMIVGTMAIMYSFYLSYIFSKYREVRVLCENLIIISYFILLVQRQNILVCAIGFVLSMFYSNRENKKNNSKERENKKLNFKKIIAVTIIMLILLYGFGIFGNIRYGSAWAWNDTSMIEKLGRINSNYPEFVSKQYFWSYIYFVSPLVNLNTNVEINSINNSDVKKYIYEFIPEFVQNKVGYIEEAVVLPVSSLTASTAYVRAHKYLGYFGMYIMFFVYMFVTTIILNISYKRNKLFHIVNCISLSYILLFTFFTNTLIYSTTSSLLILTFIMSFKYKIGNYKLGG